MEVIFFITLALYLFVVGSCTDFVDYDFFARLIVGKTFFQTGDILKYDFLSYSNTHPWYDHEWGASVIFYFLQNHFGDIGLLIFKTACLVLAFFFFTRIIKLRRKVLTPGEKFAPFNFLFFFAALVVLYKLIYSLRCHHFTFVFFAVWLYVLEKARLEKNYRVLWVLPPLMIVWSNIHGGCFMGLFITGLYIVGEMLNKKRFLPYIYTLLASFALMFVNPYGIEYVKFLVKAATMSRPNIIEWQAPFSKYFMFKLIKFKLFLAAFWGIFLYRFIKLPKKDLWQKTDKTKLVLLLALCLLALKSMRCISYFVFIVVSFCYDDFYAVFNKKLPEKWNKIKELTIFGVMFLIFILNVSVRDLKYRDWHTIFPISEIEFLIENNIKGNLFVPFECGSYAAYKLYPDNFILQDGRYEEVYNLDLNDNYAKIISLGLEGWPQLLDKIHHDIIITYKKYAFYENLKQHPDYYLIMESKTFALFLRKDLYARLKKPVHIPTDDPEFYKKTLWATKINWGRP